MTPSTDSRPIHTERWLNLARQNFPGLALCICAATLGMAISRFVPGVSALLVAIVLGVTITNVYSLPSAVMPGVTFASKRLLRVGIVLLGLKLVLSDILGLGAAMLLVIAVVVAGGIIGTTMLGRLLGVNQMQSLLIGCGFSICGAAAIAAVDSVLEPEDEDVIAAVALVVIFGTLMIPVVPLVAEHLGMNATQSGLWAGASIHEIAQVVAAGGIIGGGALSVAVVAKLARVLMLTPVIAVLVLRQRRLGEPAQTGKRPPVVPMFMLAFLAMVLLRSTFQLPSSLLRSADALQTSLLSAAMFGLGCGVRLRDLAGIGFKPFALAGASTVWVAAIGLTGIAIIS